jgi:hypothetical protein
MGDIHRVDSFAMEAVAEYLEAAASDIRVVGLNWPDPEQDSATTVDLHAESARLWVDGVLERLDVWAKRARRAADALDRTAVRHRR